MGRGVRKHPVFKLSSCRNVPILKSCKEIILFQNRPSQTAIELRPQSIESGKPAGKPGKLFIASVSTPSPVTRETTKITRNWNSCLLNHHRHHLTSPCFGSSYSTWEWGGQARWFPVVAFWYANGLPSGRPCELMNFEFSASRHFCSTVRFGGGQGKIWFLFFLTQPHENWKIAFKHFSPALCFLATNLFIFAGLET